LGCWKSRGTRGRHPVREAPAWGCTVQAFTALKSGTERDRKWFLSSQRAFWGGCWANSNCSPLGCSMGWGLPARSAPRKRGKTLVRCHKESAQLNLKHPSHQHHNVLFLFWGPSHLFNSSLFCSSAVEIEKKNNNNQTYFETKKPSIFCFENVETRCFDISQMISFARSG